MIEEEFMNKFKKGDIVTPNGACMIDLTMGKRYEVVEVYSGVIVTLALDDSGTYATREQEDFDLVESPSYPNPPHPRRDLIIEWANGADIQYFSDILERWEDVTLFQPSWSHPNKYRLKPTEEKSLTKTQRIEQLEKRVKELESKL